MVSVYTVNVPLKCSRHCLYIITEHRRVNIALYLLRLLLCMILRVHNCAISCLKALHKYCMAAMHLQIYLNWTFVPSSLNSAWNGNLTYGSFQVHLFDLTDMFKIASNALCNKSSREWSYWNLIGHMLA